MSKFVFTRNGVTYEIEGPTGATAEQAEAILDAQIFSGSLIGLSKGQQLNLATQITQGLVVDSLPVAEQVQIQNAQTKLQLPSIVDVPVVGGITISDMASQPSINKTIGKLSSQALQGLNAQIAKTVNQQYDLITNQAGVGQYGFDVPQLESTGYLKPGTNNLASAAGNLVSTLSSPAVWTGKDNVNNLKGLLDAPKIQTGIQTTLMEQSYSQLASLGILSGKETPQTTGGILNIASKYGTATAVKWVNETAPGKLITELNSVAKLGEYAVNFSNLNVGTGSIDTRIPISSNIAAVTGINGVLESAGGAGNLPNLLTAVGSGAVPGGNILQQVVSNPTVSNLLNASGLASNANINSLGTAGAALLGVTGIAPGSLTSLLQSTGGLINANGTINTQNLGAAGAALLGATGLSGPLTSLLQSTGGLNPQELIAKSLSGIGLTGIDSLLKSGSATNALSIAASQLFNGSLAGSLGGLTSGVSALTNIGPIGAVFGGFLGGGGSGDSAGLNFSLNSNPIPAYGYKDTVNRATVDAASTRIYGNPKIPPISFGLSSLGSAIKVDAGITQTIKSLLGVLAVSDARQYQTNFLG